LAKQIPKDQWEGTTVSQTPLTQAGAVVGTLHYMAPEVVAGGEADARSDIWGLGVVLYEMTTGELPFQGRTVYELAMAIQRDPPRPLRGSTPSELEAIINRSLAKDPAQRFQTAGDVGVALETIGIVSPPVNPALRPRRRKRSINSLAVRPFENVGGDPDKDYLSEGLAEGILYRISQLPKLNLAAYSTASRYRGRRSTRPAWEVNSMWMRSLPVE